MSLEVGRVPETLVANLAFKRPFASVHTHMTIEVSHTVECLCADVALKVLHSVYALYCVR